MADYLQGGYRRKIDFRIWDTAKKKRIRIKYLPKHHRLEKQMRHNLGNHPRDQKLIVQIVGMIHTIFFGSINGMSFAKPGLGERSRHLADSPTHAGFIWDGF